MNDPRYSEIRILELPPMRVVSSQVVSATPEEDVSRKVAEWVAAEQLAPLRTFGFDVDVTPAQRMAGMRGYELWVVAPPEVRIGEAMRRREFQGGLYAVMTIIDAFDDPFGRIPSGWEHLHNWVMANPQYEGAEHQMLEEVIVEDRAGAEVRRHLAIYYPIVPIAVGVPT